MITHNTRLFGFVIVIVALSLGASACGDTPTAPSLTQPPTNPPPTIPPVEVDELGRAMQLDVSDQNGNLLGGKTKMWWTLEELNPGLRARFVTNAGCPATCTKMGTKSKWSMEQVSNPNTTAILSLIASADCKSLTERLASGQSTIVANGQEIFITTPAPGSFTPLSFVPQCIAGLGRFGGYDGNGGGWGIAWFRTGYQPGQAIQQALLALRRNAFAFLV